MRNRAADGTMISLEELDARLAVHDVLLRYCRAVDRADLELLKSVYHPDATDQHGPFTGRGHDFADWLLSQPGRERLVTQHHLTNSTVRLDGDRAMAETYFLAHHWEAPSAETGEHATLHQFAGRYLDCLERREGEWRIADRVVVHDWSLRGDTGTAWPGMGDFPTGAPVPDDPSTWLFAAPRGGSSPPGRRGTASSECSM